MSYLELKLFVNFWHFFLSVEKPVPHFEMQISDGLLNTHEVEPSLSTKIYCLYSNA